MAACIIQQQVQTLTLTFTLTILMALTPVVRSQTKSSVMNLYTSLFDSSVYIPQFRPVPDQADVLSVSLTLALYEIGGIDDKAQTLTTVGMLWCVWNDAGLTWDAASYGGIASLSGVSQSEIWVPDIIVDNGVNNVGQLEMLGYKEKKLRLHSDGTVQWDPSLKAVTTCAIDVSYYPFDSQLCSVRLTTGSSIHDEVDLGVSQLSGDVDWANFQNDSTWRLERYTVTWGSSKHGKSVISYNVLLSRRPEWYLINIVFPVIFMSFTSPVVFLIPVAAGEKMGTSITVLLAFAVYLTIISDSLPETSITTSVLNHHLNVMLLLCVVSFLLSAFVIRLHHTDTDRKKQPVGRNWRKLVRVLKVVTCSGCGRRRNHVTTVTPVQEKKPPTGVEVGKPVGVEFDVADDDDDEMEWPDVAGVVDWFLFLVFTFMITFLSMIVFVHSVHRADVSREELKNSMGAGLMAYGTI